MIKNIATLLTIFSILVMPVFAIANPASEYCVKQGYKSEIRTDSSGNEYGVCIMSDGKECEEFALYRGEGCIKYNENIKTPEVTTNTIIDNNMIYYVLAAVVAAMIGMALYSHSRSDKKPAKKRR